MEYTRIIPVPGTTCEIANDEEEGAAECGKPTEWVAVTQEGVRLAMCSKCLGDMLTDDLAKGEWAIGLDGITTTEGDC
jgi:hypothetical protein